MPLKKQAPVVKENPSETSLLGHVSYSAPKSEAAASKELSKTIPIRSTRSSDRKGLDNTQSQNSLRRSLFKQIEKQPQNPNPWILLGWSSADARSAATYFKHALEIDPENPVARDGLEWACSEMGVAAYLQVDTVTVEAPSVDISKTSADAALSQLILPTQSAEIMDTAVAEAIAAPAKKSRLKVQDFRWRTISRFYQIPFFRNLGIAVAYLFMISSAEVITVLVDPIVGLILHASIMLGLIVHGSVIQQGPFRRYLVILALAPLIRVLSLSLPMALFDIPVMYRYMIVGVPILLAAYFSARSVGLAANRLYFTWKGWPFQVLFSFVGLLLGYCEYLILHPTELVPSTGWFDIAMGMFILFVFTGFLEEFIFRSLLQVTGIQLFGGFAIWIISILFGILHIGYYSFIDVLFATLVGAFFGYFALKTRSLLGVSLAHGITNITLYILLPLVLR